MPIKNVCVFCGASSHYNKAYQVPAEQIATALVKAGYNIVYGAGNVGLVGVVANSAIKAGGKVTGVITEHLNALEKQHDGLWKLEIVKTMSERKDRLFDLGDAYVILPGGFGTLDEMFCILTLKQLGLLGGKKIVLFNPNGFWNPIIEMIKKLDSECFIPPGNLSIFNVITEVDELAGVLAAPEEPTPDPTEKWS